MEARAEKIDNVVVVHLTGCIDFQSADAFREVSCKELLADRLIFDFNELSFVGSCGITSFTDSIIEIMRNNGNGVKFCGLSSEFRRIFESKGVHSLYFFDDLFRARYSFFEEDRYRSHMREASPETGVNSSAMEAQETSVKAADIGVREASSVTAPYGSAMEVQETSVKAADIGVSEASPVTAVYAPVMGAPETSTNTIDVGLREASPVTEACGSATEIEVPDTNAKTIDVGLSEAHMIDLSNIEKDKL